MTTQQLQHKIELCELALLRSQSENPYKKSKITYNQTRLQNLKKKLHDLQTKKPFNKKKYLQQKYGLFAWKHNNEKLPNQ